MRSTADVRYDDYPQPEKTCAIMFTGHRDLFMGLTDDRREYQKTCLTSVMYGVLKDIMEQYTVKKCMHGGAIGADELFDGVYRDIRLDFGAYNSEVEVFRPNYSAYSPKSAPIVRNMQMLGRLGGALVDKKFLIAYLDPRFYNPETGLAKGGTAKTVRAFETMRSSDAFELINLFEM